MGEGRGEEEERSERGRGEWSRGGGDERREGGEERRGEIGIECVKEIHFIPSSSNIDCGVHFRKPLLFIQYYLAGISYEHVSF